MADAPESERYVRITDGGKIKTYVANSLKFLEEDDENKTVVLHTLPSQMEPALQLSDETKKLLITQQIASHAVFAIPRLISVAEIIKREYVKNLQEKRSSRMRGLYQYNEIGTLEQLGVSINPSATDSSKASPEELRSSKIIEALKGKNHTKQTQSPYMRIVLSTIERPELMEKGATFQPPQKRKVSKNAKARARKREKKVAKAQLSHQAPEVPSESP